MHFSILKAAREAPNQPALIQGARTWSFRDLAAEVSRVLEALGQELEGRKLGSRGLTPGSPVALVGALGAPTLIELYALIELSLPVILLHPRWAPAERQAVIRQTGVQLVLDRDPSLEPSDSKSICDSGGEPPGREPPKLPGALAVVFTSGSQGRPKGAVLSHRAFAAAAAASAANLGWKDDDRWLLSLPIAHVGGLSVVTRCLAAQRTVVLADSPHFDPWAFDHQVRRDRVTIASLVPTMLRRLLDARPRFHSPRHLRALLLGGAPAAPDLLAEAAERDLPVLTTYGLTEACSQVATQAPGTVNRGDLGAGPPLPGVQVRIEDGEIQVLGEALMDGYWSPDREGPEGPPGPPRPPVRLDPPFTEDGWFATGDLGRVDAEGNLHVLGRRSELLISGGENVHPAEVEAVLTTHPHIEAACVFGTEDREWGQRVAAALVAGASGPPKDEDLFHFLETRLASFKRPRRIAYLEGLPLLPNGKADRRAAAAAARPLLRPF